jgi:hypothetical protein
MGSAPLIRVDFMHADVSMDTASYLKNRTCRSPLWRELAKKPGNFDCM